MNSDREYYPNFIENSDELFEYFYNNLIWQQYKITMFGKVMNQPRLICYYGDIGVNYKYSQTRLYGTGRDLQLQKIKDALNIKFGLELNSVLCNLYRDNNDSMGRHSDNEKELGINPIICSLSLGAERRFDVKDKFSIKTGILLQDGSLLYMGKDFQNNYLHSLAKTSKYIGPRINLTFRTIKK